MIHPITWIKEYFSVEPEFRLTINCDLDECEIPITDEEAIYNHKNKKIYHTGECSHAAYYRESENFPETKSTDFGRITIDNAIKLLQKGELKQFEDISKLAN